MLQLQLMDENKFKREKKDMENIKKSERVVINKENEEFYVDKVPTGLRHQFFCMIFSNKLKNSTNLLLFWFWGYSNLTIR